MKIFIAFLLLSYQGPSIQTEDFCSKNSANCKNLQNMSPEELEIFENLHLEKSEIEMAEKTTFVDTWGAVLNWTNSEEGWYPLRRYQYMDIRKRLNEQIKVGFSLKSKLKSRLDQLTTIKFSRQQNWACLRALLNQSLS